MRWGEALDGSRRLRPNAPRRKVSFKGRDNAVSASASVEQIDALN
jgi:hypothetical protein